jgi:hypothetical protein
MPRKKIVKSAARKNQSSKQATKAPANTLLRMEKEFSEAPAKFAEQLTKEITALKQKENKLNTTLTKIQVQVSKIEKSIAAAKKPASAAGKKQLLAAKKALNDTKKDYALSNTALKETTTALTDAEIRLARVTALAKCLKGFEKDWAQQAKKLKDNAKAKAAGKSKPKATTKTRAGTRRTGKNQPQQPALTVIEQTSFDSFDNAADETQLDEAKQANS